MSAQYAGGHLKRDALTVYVCRATYLYGRRVSFGADPWVLFQVRRQSTAMESVDDGIENYDYENANDRENYCPGDHVSHCPHASCSFSHCDVQQALSSFFRSEYGQSIFPEVNEQVNVFMVLIGLLGTASYERIITDSCKFGEKVSKESVIWCANGIL